LLDKMFSKRSLFTQPRARLLGPVFPMLAYFSTLGSTKILFAVFLYFNLKITCTTPLSTLS